ncbi:MAG: type VI secretion system Vgr family protein [Thermoanaerobaculaceae bacterium]
MAEIPAHKAQYSCAIGGQTFQVLGMQGYEEVSQLFRFNLSLWLDDSAVDIAGLVRQTAEIKIKWGDKERTYFGIVASVTQTAAGKPGLGGVDKEWGEYSVEVVPTLWLLSQKTNSRIFQEKKADDIIKQVLDERGMAGKYELRLSKSYPQREYCVQYRENDMAFVCRLMEEEGMFYFFTHDGQELMVIGDSTSAYGTCAPDAEVKFKGGSGELSTAEEYLFDLRYSENAYIGRVVFKDFDYRDPDKPLKVDKSAPKNTDLEIYDYHPERYRDDGRGRSLAQVLVDAESVWRKTLAASGTYRSASVGCKTTLSGAYRSDLNGSWLVVQVNHSATQRGDTGVQYGVSIYAIPADMVPRIVPRTPKPALNPQTATVVGPAGEQVFMDDHGRAKVQFHWDLEGKHDEDSSCWIRVAQPYAGIDRETQKKHGFQWHPLIGDEVVVDFLEGDPDRPLIVGSVYNYVNVQPVKPEELVRNIVLTRYQHRLLMDDKNTAITLNTGGSERLFMEDGSAARSEHGNNVKLSTADGHWMQLAEGQKARGIHIETAAGNRIVLDDLERNITAETTDGHLAVLDDQNRRILVRSTAGHTILIDDSANVIVVKDSSGSHSLTIDAAGSAVSLVTAGRLDVTVGTEMTLTVGGSMAVTVGASSSVTVGTDRSETIGASETVMVGASRSTSVGGSDVLTVGGSRSETVATVRSATVGSVDRTAVGANRVLAVGGSNVETVGGAYSLTAAAIKMKTGPFKVTSTAAKIEGTKITLQAAMVTVKGSGAVKVKGAVVKLN